MKKAITRWGFGAAFLAVAAYSAVTLNGPHGFRALKDKQRLIQDMQKRNGAEAQRIERIREHIKRLNENPAEQDLEIRDRLKLVRPDEKVFITGEPARQ